MICTPCKGDDHKQCPGLKEVPYEVAIKIIDDPVTGENERIHRQSQCACQHRER